jgi:hypothetical protein
MIELIIGIVGMLFILIGFILEEFTKYNHQKVGFNVINILGAGLLVYYAFVLNSWPFMVLNAVWLITASYKLSRIMR